MDTHIIQKRDLLEMLAPHHESMGVVVETDGGEVLPIDLVTMRNSRICIQVLNENEGGKLSELKEQNEHLSKCLESAQEELKLANEKLELVRKQANEISILAAV